MSEEDDRAFLEEMSDVVPLKRERRARRPRPGSAPDPSLARRRQAAQQHGDGDGNPLTDREIEPLDPWYVLEFKRPGIQNGVYRKLKQGRYEPEARLDLHRMTVATARREVFEFLQEAYRFGLRSVLMIHGKGEKRSEQERSAVLKAYLNLWLRDIPDVQAFHSAQPRHGGTGAVYVLLRKSEDQKRENRERFAKGRVSPD